MNPEARGSAIVNLLLLALISISLAGCGSKTKSAITLTPAPTVSSFSASAPLLSPATTGQAGSKLSWEVTGASKLTIDNKVGDVTGTSLVVYPAATTTYTLIAANSIGDTATATVTVKVRNNLSVINGTPFAGTDRPDYSWTLAICEGPHYLATDASGNIYAIDAQHGAVCKITPNGNVTVLATASWATGIVVTADGNTVYFADGVPLTAHLRRYLIRKIAIASNGTPTVSDVAGGDELFVDTTGLAARFGSPWGLAMDAAGNLYFADNANYAILKIAFAADGSATVSTLAGDRTQGHVDGAADVAEFGYLTGIAASADGKSIYVTDYSHIFYDPEADYWHTWTGIRKISIDAQGAATVSSVVGRDEGYQDGDNTAAQFGYLAQLALSSDGTVLYVGDASNNVVRKIVMAGDGTAAVTTAAGTPNQMGQADGAADAAWFEKPFGVALHSAGNLYISDYTRSMTLPELHPSSNNSMTLRKLALATNKVLSVVLNVFGNTGGSADDEGTKAAFNVPSGAVTDGSGNIYVADSLNSTIRKITIDTDGTSTVSTLAGTAGIFGSADGTGAAASFDEPLGLAIDTPSNSLYIADTGNGTIRKIDLTTAAVTTVAGTAGQHNYSESGGIAYPWRLAVDSTGVVYLSDIYNRGIRTVDPATGTVTVLDLADSPWIVRNCSTWVVLPDAGCISAPRTIMSVFFVGVGVGGGSKV
jgi:sugar lactone lactonase YvrE